MLVVVALGGNAIQRRDEAGTASEQRAAIREACASLAKLASRHELVVTHGNGPQVGLLLAQNEAASPLLPAMPLDVLDAESQGMIGYLLQQELAAALARVATPKPVTTIVTQVVVDPGDRAFTYPTKPVGAWLSKAVGENLRRAGVPVVELDGRYRRTVPSPSPVAIVEIDAVRALLASGCVPIVAGGGGVPVVREGNGTRGVAAVIDKDRTAALIVRELNAGALLILTDVDAVLVDGKPVRRLASDHAALALAAGEFPPGSMGPKIEAALEARSAGARAVIARLDRAVEALDGEAGTEIE